MLGASGTPCHAAGWPVAPRTPQIFSRFWVRRTFTVRVFTPPHVPTLISRGTCADGYSAYPEEPGKMTVRKPGLWGLRPRDWRGYTARTPSCLPPAFQAALREALLGARARGAHVLLLLVWPTWASHMALEASRALREASGEDAGASATRHACPFSPPGDCH